MITLELDPADGGKVTRLRCERHGREWLHGPTGAAPDAPDQFGASRSWGWDELFPTVLAAADAPEPWPALRDHGELWGRPWTALDGTTLQYADDGYRFTRSLSLDGDMLRARYEMRNVGERAFPWMWAMHPIFTIEPGDRLELPGVRVGRLEPPDGETVLKLYAGPRARHTARIVGQTCTLELTSALPYVGVYLNLGGWPAPGSGLHQIGLEPTTAPVDDLASAAARGLARSCAPGGHTAWTVEVRVD